MKKEISTNKKLSVKELTEGRSVGRRLEAINMRDLELVVAGEGEANLFDDLAGEYVDTITDFEMKEDRILLDFD